MTIEEMIEEIKASNKAVLPAYKIAKLVNKDATKIIAQAHSDPSTLGFPVIIVGKTVRIPRIPFLRFLGAID